MGMAVKFIVGYCAEGYYIMHRYRMALGTEQDYEASPVRNSFYLLYSVNDYVIHQYLTLPY